MSVLPGASYRASNASVIAKRHLLNLEDPVRLKFEPWSAENPLYEWYRRRTHRFVDMIQLRKEREAPFFHEFIVFRLRDGGGFFRIDRRQRPDEDTPLDCMYTNGVEAHDTIEQVSSFDDMLSCASDCLIEIEIKTDLHLAFILRICNAIHLHPRAKVYTLQRYNCYFFAQTIICCTARSVLQHNGTPEVSGLL